MFGSGYLANTGIIPALIGRDDLVLIDELAHACLWAGARLSRATVLPFRHSDVAHLEALLAEHRGRHPRALIATDGVFSMDGDLAPLPELAALAQRHDAWLMIDDAHGIGVVGGGRGSTFAHGVDGRRAAADGHAVEGDRRLWRLSLRLGRGDRSDPQPRAHLGLFDRPAAGDRRRPRSPRSTDRARSRLRGAAARQGAHVHARCSICRTPASPIVPVVIGEAEAALKASQLLEDEGFLVIAIRPPTVPAGTARLRFTFTAAIPTPRSSASPRSCASASWSAETVAAVFVTATGTDVGKTFVTAALIRHFASAGTHGRRAQAGGQRLRSGERWQDSDPGRAARGARTRRRRSRRSSASRPGGSRRRSRPTWRRGAKAAPSTFRRWSSSAAAPMAARRGDLLIEGVGGIMVPLDDRHTVLDWMSALRIPVLLVAGSYLGTISHTLTALHVLAQRNLDIAGVVVSESDGSAALARRHGRDHRAVRRSRSTWSACRGCAPGRAMIPRSRGLRDCCENSGCRSLKAQRKWPAPSPTRPGLARMG